MCLYMCVSFCVDVALYVCASFCVHVSLCACVCVISRSSSQNFSLESSTKSFSVSSAGGWIPQ